MRPPAGKMNTLISTDTIARLLAPNAPEITMKRRPRVDSRVPTRSSIFITASGATTPSRRNAAIRAIAAPTPN